jgi:hypothetical protein
VICIGEGETICPLKVLIDYNLAQIVPPTMNDLNRCNCAMGSDHFVVDRRFSGQYTIEKLFDVNHAHHCLSCFCSDLCQRLDDI